MKSGEAFSSWLHRSAFANGMSDHTYCRHVFGSRSVWNRDVDHVVDAGMLAAATAATGESQERLRRGTLHVYDGTLHAEALRGGHIPWILSLGVYHRTRRRHGLQYCPLCLGEGEVWVRLQWRVAWTVCCPFHHCFLRDACPRCDAPFVFHRTSLAIPGRSDCHRCGTNLATRDVVTASQRTLRFQTRLTHALERGCFDPRSLAIDALPFFDGLRTLARGIFSQRNWVGLCDTLPRALRRQAPPTPKMQIEHWRISTRIFALEVLRRTLIDWPEGFVAGAQRAGVYRARFGNPNQPSLPPWLDTAMVGLARPMPVGLLLRKRRQTPLNVDGEVERSPR